MPQVEALDSKPSPPEPKKLTPTPARTEPKTVQLKQELEPQNCLTVLTAITHRDQPHPTIQMPRAEALNSKPSPSKPLSSNPTPASPEASTALRRQVIEPPKITAALTSKAHPVQPHPTCYMVRAEAPNFQPSPPQASCAGPRFREIQSPLPRPYGRWARNILNLYSVCNCELRASPPRTTPRHAMSLRTTQPHPRHSEPLRAPLRAPLRTTPHQPTPLCTTPHHSAPLRTTLQNLAPPLLSPLYTSPLISALIRAARRHAALSLATPRRPSPLRTTPHRTAPHTTLRHTTPLRTTLHHSAPPTPL
jgi:hypothetical protein